MSISNLRYLYHLRKDDFHVSNVPNTTWFYKDSFYYQSELLRYHSFYTNDLFLNNNPFIASRGQTLSNIFIKKLASAGFYYRGFDDVVECFECGLSLHKLHSFHDAFEMHKKSNSVCRFVKGEECGNIRVGELNIIDNLLSTNIDNIRIYSPTIFQNTFNTLYKFNFYDKSHIFYNYGVRNNLEELCIKKKNRWNSSKRELERYIRRNSEDVRQLPSTPTTSTTRSIDSVRRRLFVDSLEDSSSTSNNQYTRQLNYPYPSPRRMDIIDNSRKCITAPLVDINYTNSPYSLQQPIRTYTPPVRKYMTKSFMSRAPQLSTAGSSSTTGQYSVNTTVHNDYIYNISYLSDTLHSFYVNQNQRFSTLITASIQEFHNDIGTLSTNGFISIYGDTIQCFECGFTIKKNISTPIFYHQQVSTQCKFLLEKSKNRLNFTYTHDNRMKYNSNNFVDFLGDYLHYSLTFDTRLSVYLYPNTRLESDRNDVNYQNSSYQIESTIVENHDNTAASSSSSSSSSSCIANIKKINDNQNSGSTILNINSNNILPSTSSNNNTTSSTNDPRDDFEFEDIDDEEYEVIHNVHMAMFSAPRFMLYHENFEHSAANNYQMRSCENAGTSEDIISLLSIEDDTDQDNTNINNIDNDNNQTNTYSETNDDSNVNNDFYNDDGYHLTNNNTATTITTATNDEQTNQSSENIIDFYKFSNFKNIILVKKPVWSEMFLKSDREKSFESFGCFDGRDDFIKAGFFFRNDHIICFSCGGTTKTFVGFDPWEIHSKFNINCTHFILTRSELNNYTYNLPVETIEKKNISSKVLNFFQKKKKKDETKISTASTSTSSATRSVSTQTDDTQLINNICIICCNRRINVSFVPCGHAIVCNECFTSQNSDICYCCLQSVNLVTKIFI